jgi:hypothetical protein
MACFRLNEVMCTEDLEFVERKFNIRYGSGAPPENKIVFVSLFYRHIILSNYSKTISYQIIMPNENK